jgi:hypothetical protein
MYKFSMQPENPAKIHEENNSKIASLRLEKYHKNFPNIHSYDDDCAT